MTLDILNVANYWDQASQEIQKFQLFAMKSGHRTNSFLLIFLSTLYLAFIVSIAFAQNGKLRSVAFLKVIFEIWTIRVNANKLKVVSAVWNQTPVKRRQNARTFSTATFAIVPR